MFSTDWWLKRAFKFALKRYLGRLLRSEVDLEHLNVQLGKGTLELKAVLLNCEYLNEQLNASQWEITAGYVGCLRLVIPLTSLSSEPLSVELEETLVTIRPRTLKKKAASADADSAAGFVETPAPSEGLFEIDDSALGPAAITDGVARIAGGIEKILQRLRAKAAGIAIRLELPSRQAGDDFTSLVILRLSSFTYEGEQSPPSVVPSGGGAPAMQLQKLLLFSGLTVELSREASDGSSISQQHAHASSDKEKSRPPGRARQLPGQAPLSTSALELGVDVGGDDSSGADSPFASAVSKLGSEAFSGLSGAENSNTTGNHQGSPLVDFQEWTGEDEDWRDGQESVKSASSEGSSSCTADSQNDENRHVIICSQEGVGCSGTLKLHLIWYTNSQQRPRAVVDLDLKPLQVQLHPHHLLLLSQLSSYFGDLSSGSHTAPAEQNGGMRPAQHPPASRSFLADLLLPDTTAVAQDFLFQSWQADQGPGGALPTAESEFHDAESLLGSIRSGLSSFVSASASGVAQGASFFSTNSGLDSIVGTADHPPIASELGGIQLQVTTQELSIVLWYPESHDRSRHNTGMRAFDYRARFSLEVGDAALSLDSSSTETTAKLQVYRVEAVEYIPTLSPANDASIPHLEEAVKIPEALPPAPGSSRTVPSVAGICISPLRKSSMYASVLSQVTSSLAASLPVGASNLPFVQIWPVLSIAGSRRSTSSNPSISLSGTFGAAPPIAARRQGQGGPPFTTAVAVDVKLRPATVWLSLAMLERVHTFLEPLIIHVASRSLSRSHEDSVRNKRQNAAVSTAIDSILDDLHGLDAHGTPQYATGKARAGRFSLTLRMPHACLLLSPERRAGSAVHLAIDLFCQTAAPLLTLRDTQLGGRPSWDAAVTLSRAKAYLVHSDKGVCSNETSMEATCVLDVSPSNSGAGCTDGSEAAMFADISWHPGDISGSDLAGTAWELVKRRSSERWEGRQKEDRSNALDEVQFQEAASSAATIALLIRAPDVCINISQNDLATLSGLASSIIRWHTRTTVNTALALGIALPLTEASPVVLELECGLRCNLKRYTQGVEMVMQDSDESLFLLSAGNLHVFVASGLDGSVASSSATLQGCRVKVTQAGNVLLCCSGQDSPGIHILYAQRQLAQQELTALALGCAVVRGATIASQPGNISFSWLQELADFLTLPQGKEEDSEPLQSGLPETSCKWSVRMHDCAVRDEPLHSADDAVAAALLLGSLQWDHPSENGRQVLTVTNISLLAADAGQRGEGFLASEAVDLPNCHLLANGYVCLAQESSLMLSMQTPSEASGAISIQGEAEELGIHKIELSNCRLHLPLTKTAWGRLNALIVRWSSAAGGQRGGSQEGLVIPGDDESSPRPSPSTSRVAVMAQVEEDAFSSKRVREAVGDGSSLPRDDNEPCYLPLAGGALEADDEMDVPGGAPVIIEDVFRETFGRGTLGSRHSCLEGGGIWYDDVAGEDHDRGILKVEEEYIKRPPPDYVPPTSQKCALGPLPEGYETPVSRVTLQNFNIVISLCQSINSGGGEGSSSRLELELEDLCVQADTFGLESSHARRLAVSIRNVELKDCSLKPDTSPAWQRILSHHISAWTPRGPSTCLLTVELEAVRPDGGSEELRLKVSALPIRLRIDQDIVTFLQTFFSEDGLEDPGTPVSAADLDVQTRDDSGGIFFQRCEVKGLTVVVDYKPRRLDVAALRAGNLAEVLNVTAWSDVAVNLPSVRLTGVHGWNALGSMLTQRYLNDIASSQVHSFIAGIKPIQSIIRIGAAAGQLLAIPAEALRTRPESSYSGRHSAVPISRQLQRGIFGLVRAILAESLGISATAIGGLHLVLAGPSAAMASSSQPSNVSEGMRQAAARLSSGFGEMGAALKAPFRTNDVSEAGSSGLGSAAVKALRAAPGALAKPISGGAAAARCALLGAKNSLDPERYESKQLRRR